MLAGLEGHFSVANGYTTPLCRQRHQSGAPGFPAASFGAGRFICGHALTLAPLLVYWQRRASLSSLCTCHLEKGALCCEDVALPHYALKVTNG